MRSTVLFGILVLVSLSCVSSSKSRRRSHHGNNYVRPIPRPILRRPFHRLVVTTPAARVDPGTTPNIMKLSEEDDKQASEKGIKVPSGDCIVSWNDFKQDVINKEWIGLYSLDDDEQLTGNQGVAFKFSARWTHVNDTTVTRQGSLWWTGTNMCIYVDGRFARIDDNKAIFTAISGNNFITSNRRDSFVCSKTRPITWCIFHICYESNKIVDGRCPSTEAVLLVRDQRETDVESDGTRRDPIRLNDLPWTEIATAFKDCLGQEFKDDTDPQIFWDWVTPNDIACAIPGTPAFDAGVAAG